MVLQTGALAGTGRKSRKSRKSTRDALADVPVNDTLQGHLHQTLSDEKKKTAWQSNDSGSDGRTGQETEDEADDDSNNVESGHDEGPYARVKNFWVIDRPLPRLKKETKATPQRTSPRHRTKQ